jgi:folylpolyglutamate synthase
MNTSAEDINSLRVQKELEAAWKDLSKDTETYTVPTIEDAVELIRSWEGEKEVFVTGSLHLIGGLYVILDEDKSA